jgi:hypothetical protein
LDKDIFAIHKICVCTKSVHAWILEDIEETSAIFVDCQSIEEMEDHQYVVCDINEGFVQPKNDGSEIVCQNKRVKWKIANAIRAY